jgi:KUP system potassium uptake protein
LAAVEGTTVAQPSFEHFVVPAAVVILIALFAVQRRGTTTVGKLFGPVMLVWFATIAVLGAVQIARNPNVIAAVNPAYAVTFFANNGFEGFLTLGAVILIVVGGEALYADMGHFGRRPIAVGWYTVVLPALVLVYFGQGALLLRDPAAIENPFYRMAPSWALYPLVVLATCATVIASQALISGSYSLMQQAVQLGFAPFVRITHTSADVIGQVYVRSVNWVLMVGCLLLVIGFRHSERLAGAYGLAVAGTMLTTTILFTVVARERFHWPPVKFVSLAAVFLVVDTSFFIATLWKIPHGGWVPLLVGTVAFTLMTTWHTGKRLVRARTATGSYPLEQFVKGLAGHEPVRAPATGVYLYATPGVTPPVLLETLQHFDSLHEQVLVTSVVFERRPNVPRARRAEISDLGRGFWKVVIRYGYLDQPNIPTVMREQCQMRLGVDADSVSYFLGRESVRSTPRPGMARWRERLYAVMSRNATDPARYFRLPSEQVVEIGVVVDL